MTSKRCFLLACFFILCAQASARETSVSIVERPDDANERVFMSDSPLPYGKTLYVADKDPGRGSVFYFTSSRSDADIVLKKPWESPRAAALRVYFYNRDPGYVTSVYVTDSSVGYGTTVYFSDDDPGYGKALYVQDERLRERKKALAVMLMLLGEL